MSQDALPCSSHTALSTSLIDMCNEQLQTDSGTASCREDFTVNMWREDISTGHGCLKFWKTFVLFSFTVLDKNGYCPFDYNIL